MDDNIKVNVEELKKICNKMIDEKNEIMNIYNSNIKEVMQTSQRFLKTKGIQIEDVESKIKELFKNFDKNMTELTDTLSDGIVPGYISLNEEIKKLFGENFASEMENLIKNKE